MGYYIDENGNVICTSAPDCSECDPMLCMQTYDPATNTWTINCESCLETNTVNTALITDWTEQGGEPSGIPTTSFPSGTVPASGWQVECGEQSKLVTFNYKGFYTWKLLGGGIPAGIKPLTGQRRRDAENSYVASNVSDGILNQFALDAFNAGKPKLAGIVCAPCPPTGQGDGTQAKACPLVKRHGQIKAVDITVTNGRIATSGPDLAMSAWLSCTIKLWVSCDKTQC